MSFQLDLPASEPFEHAVRALDPCAAEMSIVDVVLLACDLSEDATEIDDLVASAIQSGAARILPGERDPMLVSSA